MREIGLQSHVHRGVEHPYPIDDTRRFGTYEVCQTQAFRAWLLLAKQGDITMCQHDVIALTVGVEQLKEGMGAILVL